MIRTRLLLLGCFVIVFAAGVSVGLLVSRVRGRPVHRSRLASELGLTAEQQEQMRSIWSEAMQSRSGSPGEGRRALRRERDEAILALLTEDQRPKYDAVLQDYERKTDELSKERRRAFEEAVEKTKQILTAEQARKYEEMIQKRRERGPGPDRPGGFSPPWSRRGRRRRGGPKTAPATESQPTSPGVE